MAKVLVASDGSEFAIDGAVRGLRLVSDDANVTVLTVVPRIMPSSEVAAPGLAATALVEPATFDEAEATRRQRGEDAAAATIAALPGEAEGRVEEGDPGSVICSIAEEEAFDLVVVASHGAGFLERALVGSVSHHVLHHAPCPVLLVRQPQPVG